MKCSKCNNEFERGTTGSYYNVCTKCNRIKNRKYYNSNKSKESQRKKDSLLVLKIAVMSHYCNGIPKCQKCGFNDIRALSIDHINGGGNKHRKEIGRGGRTIYRWLKKHSYPDDFQVLCMNCQFIKEQENKLKGV